MHVCQDYVLNIPEPVKEALSKVARDNDGGTSHGLYLTS